MKIPTRNAPKKLMNYENRFDWLINIPYMALRIISQKAPVLQ